MNAQVLILIACALLAGAARAGDAQPFKPLADDKKLRGMLIEHSELKDPFTVEFRSVVVREVLPIVEGNPTKHVFCGELNAKNSYGGYAGWSRFVVADIASSPIIVISDGDSGLIMINLLCKDSPKT